MQTEPETRPRLESTEVSHASPLRGHRPATAPRAEPGRRPKGGHPRAIEQCGVCHSYDLCYSPLEWRGYQGPFLAPPRRPMPAPAQKWPLVPSPLERRVTEVVGMTNAGLVDCARMSALWATPRLGARSSGRTKGAKRRGMRNLRGLES